MSSVKREVLRWQSENWTPPEWLGKTPYDDFESYGHEAKQAWFDDIPWPARRGSSLHNTHFHALQSSPPRVGTDAPVLREPRDAPTEAEVKNYLVQGARELITSFNPENLHFDGDGGGACVANIEAVIGNGIGCGRSSSGSRDGGGIGCGSIFAKDGNGASNGPSLEPHISLGLIHSGGLDDIREFTTFILLQSLIRRE